MSAIACQAITKKGTPCKKKSVDGLFCRQHGGVEAVFEEAVLEEVVLEETVLEASVLEEGATETKESTKTFDAIVQTGANLVDALEKAIGLMPNLMDNLFKYTGAKMMMPALSEKMQEAATEKARAKLQKIQLDLINKGADPEKLDQLLEKTRALEKVAADTLKMGDKYIPAKLKAELTKALSQLQTLRNKNKD